MTTFSFEVFSRRGKSVSAALCLLFALGLFAGSEAQALEMTPEARAKLNARELSGTEEIYLKQQKAKSEALAAQTKANESAREAKAAQYKEIEEREAARAAAEKSAYNSSSNEVKALANGNSPSTGSGGSGSSALNPTGTTQNPYTASSSSSTRDGISDASAQKQSGSSSSTRDGISDATAQKQYEEAKKQMDCSNKEFAAMVQATSQDTVAQKVAIDSDTYTKRWEAFKKSGAKNLGGDFNVKFCIDRITKDYFSALRDLLNPIAMLLNKLQSLLMSLLNQACEAVITAINNALSSVCIPLPNLNLDLSLGLNGQERKTCDGISLASVFKVSQAGIPEIGGGFGTSLADRTAGAIANQLPPLVRDADTGSSSSGKSSTYSKN